MAHPFKERLVELQMLALYRCGRQADALAAFHAARARFVEELGIEPGQPLRVLHQDVLGHADTLGPEPTSAPPRRAGRPQVAGAAEPHDRPRARARCDRRTASRGSCAAAHADRPGGVGKTRLAVETARRVEQDFAEGACFVSLAALQRPDDVPGAIVSALGAVVISGESPFQALERFLGSKHLLLVVDNFEHVLAAAPVLGGLLEVCPALTVLATSREPLALYAEERYPVSPLALPGARDARRPTGAGGRRCCRAVLRARASPRSRRRRGNANLAVVAEICRRLDGLPLAIELTAARCGLLSVGEIAERLGHRAGPGARDAPARQQTLRATIDWSHKLLDDDEKHCFARFAVFAGGATVDAAEAVTRASLDTLDHLVAKSLLVRRREANAPTRVGHARDDPRGRR